MCCCVFFIFLFWNRLPYTFAVLPVCICIHIYIQSTHNINNTHKRNVKHANHTLYVYLGCYIVWLVCIVEIVGLFMVLVLGIARVFYKRRANVHMQTFKYKYNENDIENQIKNAFSQLQWSDELICSAGCRVENGNCLNSMCFACVSADGDMHVNCQRENQIIILERITFYRLFHCFFFVYVSSFLHVSFEIILQYSPDSLELVNSVHQTHMLSSLRENWRWININRENSP